MPGNHGELPSVRNFDFDVGQLWWPPAYEGGEMDILAEGMLSVRVPTVPGQFREVSFPARVFDGHLDLEFRSRTEKPWAVCGLVISRP